MAQIIEPLDVWLRFISDDDEDAEADAITFRDGDQFRVDWSLTSVGLVTSRWFPTYDEAAAWLTAEGFRDYTS